MAVVVVQAGDGGDKRDRRTNWMAGQGGEGKRGTKNDFLVDGEQWERKRFVGKWNSVL